MNKEQDMMLGIMMEYGPLQDFTLNNILFHTVLGRVLPKNLTGFYMGKYRGELVDLHEELPTRLIDGVDQVIAELEDETTPLYMILVGMMPVGDRAGWRAELVGVLKGVPFKKQLMSTYLDIIKQTAKLDGEQDAIYRKHAEDFIAHYEAQL